MSDLERPILREEFDNMPRESYAGLGHPAHRYADYIPVADGADQFALRQSIEAIGLVEPIVMYQGAILDGRHRYKACTVLGVEPTFIHFQGDDEAALQFVLAKNIARRNLTTAQKLSLRDKLAPEIERLRVAAAERMLAGGNPEVPGPQGRTADKIGELVGLSASTVKRADAIQRATEEFPDNDFLAEQFAKVLTGEKGVKTAWVDTSAELDRLAKKDTAKVDPSKQRAVLVSAIRKARVALCDWDPGLLVQDYEVADDIDALEVWLDSAGRRVR